MPGKQRKPRPQTVRLHATLEKLVLQAVSHGLLPPDVVKAEELSPIGSKVRVALEDLHTVTGTGAAADAIVLAMVERGTSELEARPYVHSIMTMEGSASAEMLLRAVRDKHLVTDLMNISAEQLATGVVSVEELLGFLQTSASVRVGGTLATVGEALKDGFPPVPQGLELTDFPALTESTGGLMGMWALAGGPGTGKSTCAWQIAMSLAPQPVLYYDFENGLPTLLARTREILGDDIAAVRKAVSHIYHRDSISTFEVDLARIAPPATVVIDSIQKLPTSLEHRRTALDQWLYRFEALKKLGYTVLLISEVNRASYQGAPNIGAFKESGEVEYTVDVGIQLKPWGSPGSGYVEAYIVKNRHRPVLGSVGVWSRHNSWAFQEGVVTGTGAAEQDAVANYNPFTDWVVPGQRRT